MLNIWDILIEETSQKNKDNKHAKNQIAFNLLK